MKSSSGKVHLTWLHPLRSGKGPQLPGSNWKPLLIFIIIVVSVLERSIHFVQSATPSFALKATYLLIPWFQGILPFLILHETRPNPNHKISQWKMHKTDKLHKELPTSWRLLVAKMKGQNGGTYCHQRNKEYLRCYRTAWYSDCSLLHYD